MFEKFKVRKHLRDFEKITTGHQLEFFFMRLMIVIPQKEKDAVINEIEKNLVKDIKQLVPDDENLAKLRVDIQELEKLKEKSQKVFTVRDYNEGSIMIHRIAEVVHNEKGAKTDGVVLAYLDEASKIPEDHRFTTFGHLKLISAMAPRIATTQGNAFNTGDGVVRSPEMCK